MREPLAQGRDDEINECAQLQRQAIPRVIDEVYRRRRRLEGVENDDHALAAFKVDDLIGQNPDEPRSRQPGDDRRIDVLTLKRERNVTAASAVPVGEDTSSKDITLWRARSSGVAERLSPPNARGWRSPPAEPFPAA